MRVRNNSESQPHVTTVRLPNSRLDSIQHDALFHLGIDLDDEETVSKFTNVKFVCVGGTASRMKSLASTLASSLYNIDVGTVGFEHSFENCRYSGYKLGHFFCVNHGIGTPSLSVVLHEVVKLLQRAQCSDVTLVRLGTCGGIGLPSGTVVVSDGALTPGFQPVFRTSILGEPLHLPVVVDQSLVADICNCHQPEVDDFSVVRGKTYCADDFYQGQGRLDGAICGYDEVEQKAFFTKLRDLGVKNIEMESAGLLAFSHKCGIKAAVVCVTLVDRLQADLPDAKEEVQSYPIQLVTKFIKSKLNTKLNSSNS